MEALYDFKNVNECIRLKAVFTVDYCFLRQRIRQWICNKMIAPVQLSGPNKRKREAAPRYAGLTHVDTRNIPLKF